MKKLLLFIPVFFLSFILYAQVPAISSRFESDVTFLASDAMKGRLTGSVYQDIAAEYIAARFMKIGLQPKGDEGSYFQTFYFDATGDPHSMANLHIEKADSVKITNVAGFVDNKAEKTIIIGAHYDHLGEGRSSFSLSSAGGIHNGADDNASGVAVMMQLAETLKNANSGYNYLFLAFSGEEFGLWGSNYYAKHPTIDLNQVAVMINLDMVGRLNDEESLMIGGVGTSPIWKDLLEKTNFSNLKLAYDESGSGPSDHTSFYYRDLPVLFYFTGQHGDYHKVSDDSDKINYDGMVKVYNNIYALIRALEDVEEIPFTKTKEPEKQRVSLKVTLGIMPDYMYNDGGLKIDGVTEDKPADHAGLKQGDIILQLGEVEVSDIQAYMKALNEIEPGDTVKMKYSRDGKTTVTDVHF